MVATNNGGGSLLSKALREPLLHFLVLGAGLFLLSALFGDGSGGSPERIVVDEAQVARLAEQFQRTWMRPPTRRELEGLAADLVREEVLYREAVALGLDKDDPAVRRRMRQKMELLNADLVEQREPTQAELQAYLDANPDRFRRPALYSFRRIFIRADESVGDPGRRAVDLLARVRSAPDPAADPESLGDPTLLPPGLDRASARDIASVFGSALAEALSAGAEGEWNGPYRSAYGLHLVRLDGREPGGVPDLPDVRSAVEREWAGDRRQQADERFYAALQARYSVEIRLPGGTGEEYSGVSPR